jgi:universal stress protein A
MYERILVPLTQHGSDEVVLEHAGSLALLTGGHVTLMHVVHSHSRDESAYLEEQMRGYLGRSVDRLQTRGVTVTARVVAGEPADAITQVAHDIGADLIVMATHGHSEVRHLFIGSVTEDVIRRSETPVLLVQPPDTGE